MADSKDTAFKTFEYRIRPNKKFIAACEKALDDSRFVYNSALEQRTRVYEASGKSIGYNEQSRQLTEARNEMPEIKNVLRMIQEDALKRLDEAFKAFFVSFRWVSAKFFYNLRPITEVSPSSMDSGTGVRRKHCNPQPRANS